MPLRIPEAKREAIVEAYRSRQKIASICADFGVDQKTVHKFANAAGVPKRGFRKLTPDAELALCRAYRDCGNAVEAARLFRITPVTARTILRRHGFTLSPRGGRRTKAEVHENHVVAGAHDLPVARPLNDLARNVSNSAHGQVFPVPSVSLRNRRSETCAKTGEITPRDCR